MFCPDKFLYLRQILLSDAAAGLVDAAQLLRIPAHGTDIQRAVRAYEQAAAAAPLLVNILQLVVVAGMARLQLVRDRGILPQQAFDQRKMLLRLLDIIRRLRQDHDAPLIADTLKESKRYRIRDAAIQVGTVSDPDRSGRGRHRSGRAHIEHIFSGTCPTLMIIRLSGFRICNNTPELHRIRGKGAHIKRVKLLRQQPVIKIRVVQIACFQERPHADIARVAAVFCVVADGPPDLPGFVIAAENSTCRHADRAVEFDFVFHENIRDPGRIHAAHRAAFKHKTEPGRRVRPRCHGWNCFFYIRHLFLLS